MKIRSVGDNVSKNLKQRFKKLFIAFSIYFIIL